MSAFSEWMIIVGTSMSRRPLLNIEGKRVGARLHLLGLPPAGGRVIFPLRKDLLTMGARAVDFMDRWIAENITEDFYGPGDAEALAERLKADAADAGFDPDVIEYETGKAILTLVREATEKRGGR
jgi:hypothetical protein